ncbi:MAG: NAD(P)-dependent oxidoreductase [Patescibacteria group bacterium]|jgi:phosphoglycerate dehydrogenase-like enzyme
MAKIVVTKNLQLLPDQIKRIKSLGEAVIYNDNVFSKEEWLKRCDEGEIICSSSGFRDEIYELKDKFFSLPFVNVKWLDKKRLKERNITVSYAPGSNKEAVAEWVISMLLTLFRNFSSLTNIENAPVDEVLKETQGLTGKSAAILGKGNIGKEVGKICKAFRMKVKYFERGKNLYQVVKNADAIINCLSTNNETIGLLDGKFFNSLKKGSRFITFTDQRICDDKELLRALEEGILAGAAHDAGSSFVGRTDHPLYKNLLGHSKLIITPHIAYNTDYSNRKVNDMMIDNIEAWIKGKPINLLD